MQTESKKVILELYTAHQGEGSLTGIPHIVVRTTGCVLRCFFGDGGYCDSFYTSWHPEKAKFDVYDFMDFCDKHKHINHIMLTGGSPTMHPELMRTISLYAQDQGMHITLETEGSTFVQTPFRIDLVSLSPKFSNSTPKVGEPMPNGKPTTQKMVDMHEKARYNPEAVNKWLFHANDYQYKPVWGGDDDTLEEIEEFRIKHGIRKDKTYLMPAGDTRDQLIKMYPIVMEKAMEMGYNFTGRPHIIAFNTDRGK